MYLSTLPQFTEVGEKSVSFYFFFSGIESSFCRHLYSNLCRGKAFKQTYNYTTGPPLVRGNTSSFVVSNSGHLRHRIHGPLQSECVKGNQPSFLMYLQILNQFIVTNMFALQQRVECFECVLILALSGSLVFKQTNSQFLK